MIEPIYDNGVLRRIVIDMGRVAQRNIDIDWVTKKVNQWFKEKGMVRKVKATDFEWFVGKYVLEVEKPKHRVLVVTSATLVDVTEEQHERILKGDFDGLPEGSRLVPTVPTIVCSPRKGMVVGLLQRTETSSDLL